MFPIEFHNLKFVFAEKFSFLSKNEKEQGKEIVGYFLTFIDALNTKIVLTSAKPFDEFVSKEVDVFAELRYREFGNQKSYKIKVYDLALAKKQQKA